MTPTLVLASASPRRKRMLEEAGFQVEVMVPAIDDADLSGAETEPRRWTCTLAWFKAAQLMRERPTLRGQPRLLLAADTMCVLDGAMIGKPADAAEAESLIRGFQERAHQVTTGVCIVDLACGARTLFADTAEVRLGALPPDLLRSHLETGAWQGKAGGYNLADALAAGWPLEVRGDPTTVMGLPMRRLAPRLSAGVAP